MEQTAIEQSHHWPVESVLCPVSTRGRLGQPRDLAQRTGVLLLSQAQLICCTTCQSNHAMQAMGQMDVTHLQKQVRKSLFAGVAKDGKEAA